MSEAAPETIYHFADPAAWAHAQALGEYAPPALAADGFLHCATHAQLAGVVARHIRGQGPRVRLQLEATLLGDALRYEWSERSGDHYPHLYGPVPLAAVRRAEPFTAPA